MNLVDIALLSMIISSLLILLLFRIFSGITIFNKRIIQRNIRNLLGIKYKTKGFVDLDFNLLHGSVCYDTESLQTYIKLYRTDKWVLAERTLWGYKPAPLPARKEEDFKLIDG